MNLQKQLNSNNPEKGIKRRLIKKVEGKKNSLYLDILTHCKESYYEKRKISIYKQWKGRFVFQTTGHYMLQRVLKKHKITNFLDIVKIHANDGRIVQGSNPLFEDTSSSVWFQ